LPWLSDDHAATDAITQLIPAYRMIEQRARSCGYDPDHPPRLTKITETL
jgi:glucosamine--fructose-6-phosphate aminotransferase (isomerizing)